jgi:hypothetical protein
MGNNALFYRNLWQAGFASRRYFFGGFGNPPFFVIPTERSGGGISLFLKEFLERSQRILKVLGIENWILHCQMVLSIYGKMARWRSP